MKTESVYTRIVSRKSKEKKRSYRDWETERKRNEGKLTMDALNLQQKVYNMLNRIAVSGGTYRDWLETVYTAGKYLDRPETPVFIGGMTQYIEFDEVISKSATNTIYGSQPLGDIAAIGRGGNQ